MRRKSLADGLERTVHSISRLKVLGTIALFRDTMVRSGSIAAPMSLLEPLFTFDYARLDRARPQSLRPLA